MVTAWNFLDGPDKNSYRYRQINNCCGGIQQRSGPRNNASFQRYVGAMRDELVEAGHELVGEDVPEFEVVVSEEQVPLKASEGCQPMSSCHRHRREEGEQLDDGIARDGAFGLREGLVAREEAHG